jgi:hypothetical protein
MTNNNICLPYQYCFIILQADNRSGITHEDELIVRGIETRRHDIPNFIKQFQTQLLYTIDIKKAEENGRKEEREVQHHNGSNNSSNNQSWSRPRDKNGRFTSSSAITTATVAPANTTAVGNTAITKPTTTTAITATTKPSLSWQNKLRDSRGMFVASTAAAPSAT